MNVLSQKVAFATISFVLASFSSLPLPVGAQKPKVSIINSANSPGWHLARLHSIVKKFPKRRMSRERNYISLTDYLGTQTGRFTKEDPDLNPPPPQGDSERSGTGKRGSCSSEDNSTQNCPPDLPLIALVPVTKNTLNVVRQQGTTLREWERTAGSKIDTLALTLAPYPTFWFYIPALRESACNIKFDLVDETDKPLITQPIPIQLSGQEGIIGLRLSSTEKPLEIEKRYRWSLEIFCPKASSMNSNVNGWVKRIERPDLMSQIKQAKGQELLYLYLNNKIWYEALTLLAENRRQDNGQRDAALNDEWAKLLKREDVDLDEIIDKPVLSEQIIRNPPNN